MASPILCSGLVAAVPAAGPLTGPGFEDAAAAEIAPLLPLRTSVTEVTLLVQYVTDGLFTPAAAFPLAG